MNAPLPHDAPGDFVRVFRTRLPRLAWPIDAAAVASVAVAMATVWLARAPFVIQPGLVLELPQSPRTDEGVRYPSLVVAITHTGLIFFRDRPITESELASELREAVRAHPEEPLLIEADERVAHGTLVRIYHLAIEAGVRSVALATRVRPAQTNLGTTGSPP
jgi:biopolymer transport protein ExbD